MSSDKASENLPAERPRVSGQPSAQGESDLARPTGVVGWTNGLIFPYPCGRP